MLGIDSIGIRINWDIASHMVYVWGIGDVMVSSDNRSMDLPGRSATLDPEQQRLQALTELGLLEAESVPVFDEATQTAAHFLDAPICVLSLMDHDRECLKAAVGLSRLGLMNELAASRQIARADSFCTQIVNSHQALVINDTTANPEWSAHLLVQRYRIRAYLGVPLLNSAGYCLGTLAVMDLVPRNFTAKEISFLELTARWSMSEYERNRLIKHQAVLPFQSSTLPAAPVAVVPKPPEPLPAVAASSAIKVRLLAQLTQELRTPLTSVMGMTSVLNREIYGPLTHKQKEYLDIVYQSGQYLLSLVNEIVELGVLDDDCNTLTLTSVDIEMLCQQAINTLEQAAKRREQEIRLSIEPGYRIWLLDKNKIRQLLYHLIFSVIQSSIAGSVVRLHVSRKQTRLNLSVWVSNPWLGDSLPYSELASYPACALLSRETDLYGDGQGDDPLDVTNASALASLKSVPSQPAPREGREGLGLMLSRHLAEVHGGQISIQGSAESGYRYVVSLPQMTELDIPV